MDYGAEVVDESFAGAGCEEETRGEEPHCWVGEEEARFGIEEEGLFEGGFVGWWVLGFIAIQRGSGRGEGAVAVSVGVLAVVEDGVLEEWTLF